MASRRTSSSSRLRSTLDRVLIHDIKNMGFRLQLLLSNLQQHYGDPGFKRSVEDLLYSTIERLDDIVGRSSAHENAILIKVALDLNEILQEIASGAMRSGSRLRPEAAAHLPSLALALSPLPPVWGDPYYLRDALACLLENALEAAAPAGKVLIRSFRAGGEKRPRAAVEIIDNGSGMSREFVEERLFRPFQTTKPDGVGLGLFTANQIVELHRGTIRVQSVSGGGTVVRLSFPAARTES